jgi:hypothetical protein
MDCFLLGIEDVFLEVILIIDLDLGGGRLLGLGPTASTDLSKASEAKSSDSLETSLTIGSSSLVPFRQGCLGGHLGRDLFGPRLCPGGCLSAFLAFMCTPHPQNKRRDNLKSFSFARVPYTHPSQGYLVYPPFTRLYTHPSQGYGIPTLREGIPTLRKGMVYRYPPFARVAYGIPTLRKGMVYPSFARVYPPFAWVA